MNTQAAAATMLTAVTSHAWVSAEPPATLRHGDHDLELGSVCRQCGEAVDERSVRVTSNTAGWDLRGPLATRRHSLPAV